MLCVPVQLLGIAIKDMLSPMPSGLVITNITTTLMPEALSSSTLPATTPEWVINYGQVSIVLTAYTEVGPACLHMHASDGFDVIL
jgi:hypothetical protein